MNRRAFLSGLLLPFLPSDGPAAICDTSIYGPPIPLVFGTVRVRGSGIQIVEITSELQKFANAVRANPHGWRFKDCDQYA